MTERHTVKNLGSHDLVVCLDEHGVFVPPGKSVTGVVTSIWHGDHRANYTVEPADAHGECAPEKPDTDYDPSRDM